MVIHPIFGTDSSGDSNLNCAFDVPYFIHIERIRRRATDHGAGSNVEPRTVALAHDCGAFEKTPRQRAGLGRARAKAGEGIETVIDPGDRVHRFRPSR
jgi:hypothetical protein